MGDVIRSLSRGYLNVIGILEFDPINFSFVLKNKRLRIWVRLRAKKCLLYLGRQRYSKKFYFTVTVTFEVIAGL